MSIIPSTAITDALTPIQRTTGETQHARKVQSDKNLHHSEEVDELDDTAVHSVDSGQKKGGGEKEGSSRERPDEEQVEIESLQPSQKAIAAPAVDGPSHLDICA